MKRIRTTCLAALAIAGVTLAGCSSANPYATDYASISGNITPELANLQQRPIDVDKDMALANNFNLRQIGDDLGRVFYTNRASRLSPHEIPNLGVNSN